MKLQEIQSMMSFLQIVRYVNYGFRNIYNSGRLSLQIRGHSTTTWTEFCHFLTPPPPCGQFLYPEHGQKQTFFHPTPTPILSTQLLNDPLLVLRKITISVIKMTIFPHGEKSEIFILPYVLDLMDILEQTFANLRVKLMYV